MCLACKSNTRSKENLEIFEGLKTENTEFHIPPWYIQVFSGKQFKEDVIDPDPAGIAEFGPFGVVNHVFLNNPADNKIIKLTEENIEEIAEKALAVVFTGVDNSVDIWAIQWEKDYIPNIHQEGVNRTDFNYKLGDIPGKENETV